MINVVHQSLPYLADREMIKKTLEESKGNIDTAVSILLDAEERASVSSQQGSSCTERDPDSDDEELVGPKKKQDRRMSRATKALRKDKAQQKKEEVIPQVPSATKADAEPTPVTEPPSPAIELPVRPHITPHPRIVPRKLKSENDDEWVNTPSDDDGDGDFQPDLDDADDDVASNYSGSNRSQSQPLPAIAPKPLHITVHTAKTYQKQPGPQRKRQTARDRIEMKKAAQKAARKESKRSASRQLEVTSINVTKNPPQLDLGIGIKTLYI
jgi:OTU domain-containing protein 3